MYDVIVVGLGGMGSATAYQLAGLGKKVLGLERHTPAHDRGSSHGGSRLIRQAYFEDPAYVPLVLRAYELWERLEAETGQDLMTLCGGLMLGRRGSEVLEGSLRSAREHDLPCELLEAEEVKRRFPALVPDPETVALYEGRAGFVGPEATINAHLARATILGAELHFEAPVLSWGVSPSEDRVRVETPVAKYEAERLVITAGAWAPELLADLSLPLQPERRVIYWFEPKGGTEPFLPDNFPVFIWEPDDGNTFSCFPLLAGERGVKTVFSAPAACRAPPKRSTGRCAMKRSDSCASTWPSMYRRWRVGASRPSSACTRTLCNRLVPRAPAGLLRLALLGTRLQVRQRSRRDTRGPRGRRRHSPPDRDVLFT